MLSDASQNHIPNITIATNGPCYAIPQQRELLDVFTCLHHKTTLVRAGRLLERNAERYLKSTDEMVRLFADVPDAIANTKEVAAQLKNAHRLEIQIGNQRSDGALSQRLSTSKNAGVPFFKLLFALLAN